MRMSVQPSTTSLATLLTKKGWGSLFLKMLCLPPSFLLMFLVANFHILQESCSIFHCIATDYEFENVGGIIKQFSNSFFKAFVKKESNLLKQEKDKKQLKKRKLNS